MRELVPFSPGLGIVVRSALFVLLQQEPECTRKKRFVQSSELAGGRYPRVLARVAGTIDTVPGCEGLVLDLDELWTELRRLSAEEGA